MTSTASPARRLVRASIQCSPPMSLTPRRTCNRLSSHSFQVRQFTASSILLRNPKLPPPPKTPIHQRAEPSKETTQTDFAAMDVLRDFAAPATSIETTTQDGFSLNNGQAIRDGSGLIMVGGDALKWRPWNASNGRLVNKKGQWEVDKVAWGVLELCWPKPDLLIVGTGNGVRPLSPSTRQDINDLGIRVEVQDTRNAAAQFNLLATERGVQQIAAAMVPLGHRDPAI